MSSSRGEGDNRTSNSSFAIFFNMIVSLFAVNRFGLSHWLQFGPLTAPTPPGSDADTEVNMVEGLLNLLLTLLTTRLHLGKEE